MAWHSTRYERCTVTGRCDAMPSRPSNLAWAIPLTRTDDSEGTSTRRPGALKAGLEHGGTVAPGPVPVCTAAAFLESTKLPLKRPCPPSKTDNGTRPPRPPFEHHNWASLTLHGRCGHPLSALLEADPHSIALCVNMPTMAVAAIHILRGNKADGLFHASFLTAESGTLVGPLTVYL